MCDNSFITLNRTESLRQCSFGCTFCSLDNAKEILLFPFPLAGINLLGFHLCIFTLFVVRSSGSVKYRSHNFVNKLNIQACLLCVILKLSFFFGITDKDPVTELKPQDSHDTGLPGATSDIEEESKL